MDIRPLVAVSALAFAVAGRSPDGTCPASTFKGSMNGTLCSNLTEYKDVKELDTCKQLCCDDPECDTYLWCPTGCKDWKSSRCWYGKKGNCSSAAQWIGETKIQPPPPPAPATRKRGFSGFLGENYTCDDSKVLGLDDSWYYNWVHESSQYNKCKGKNTSYEFVPMVIGLGIAENMIGNTAIQKDWAERNVHFLLGYNEPDYGNGHNHPHMCKPADAAKDWVKVQELAASFDPPLALVGPGISSNGWDAWDENGRSIWLDHFLKNCSDVVEGCDVSLIKYIAFHDYVGNATALKQRVEGAYKFYGRKIWLTEFALGKWTQPLGPERSVQDAYMAEALNVLDESEAVFRYAWFTARNKPTPLVGRSSLLSYNTTDLTPTSTGQIYMNQ